MYLILSFSFVFMAGVNIRQFCIAKRAVARVASMAGTVEEYLREADEGMPLGSSSWLLSPTLVGLGTGIAVLESVWIFTDRAAFLPLINPDELALEFGQYSAVSIAIFAVVTSVLQGFGFRREFFCAPSFLLCLPGRVLKLICAAYRPVGLADR